MLVLYSMSSPVGLCDPVLPIPLSSRLCSKLQIQTDMDSAYLLETLAGNFMDVVQYNEDNREFEVRESWGQNHFRGKGPD